MIDLVKIYDAARVRRWHTNARLSWTDDFLDGHQGRVARLIVALHPAPPVALLVCALTHDDGEHGLADIGRHACIRIRLTDNALWARLSEIEDDSRRALWGCDAPALSEDDALFLKLCDLLDAYIWAGMHAPAELRTDDWIADRRTIMAHATALNVVQPVRSALLRVEAR